MPTWTTQLIDDTDNDFFQSPAVACDAAGVFHMAYVDTDASLVKYARFDGTTVTRETIDSLPPNEERDDTAIAIDPTGVVWVVWGSANGVSPRTMKTNISQRALDGTWSTTLVDSFTSTVYQLWSYSGYFGLALDGASCPHLVTLSKHPAANQLLLKHIWWDGATWQSEYIDQVGTRSAWGDISLRIDEAGGLHTAYADYISPTDYLRYAYKPLGGAWSCEAASLAAGTWVNQWLDLVVDSGGFPHIVYEYSDNPTSGLVHVWKDGTGWHNQVIASTPPLVNVGFQGPVNLAVASDVLHLTYNDTGTPGDKLYYRTCTAGAWSEADAVGSLSQWSGYISDMGLDSQGNPAALHEYDEDGFMYLTYVESVVPGHVYVYQVRTE